MSFRKLENAVKDVEHQQHMIPSQGGEPAAYRAIIVWRKNYEVWADKLYAAVDTARYTLHRPPLQRTKNQLVIATAR